MAKLRKQLNKLILMLVCLLLTIATVSATGSCTLRIRLWDSQSQPIPGVRLEVFQVARFENGSQVLTDGFRQLGIAPDTLAADPDSAESVYQYVYAYGLTGSVHTTDSSGFIVCGGLEQGIYLVMERGGQAVTFAPYLVTLPAHINGVNQSAVTSTPKLSDSGTAVQKVVKLWDDGDNAVGKRPGTLEVTLLRDGVPLRRVTLNDSNAWQHTFRELPDSGIYTVTEDSVPHYAGELTATEDGFILRNTFDDGESGGGGSTGTERAHVSVSKVWDDNNDAAGKRTTHVTVQLIADGVVTRTATLRKANHWQHTFRELDPEKQYTVREIPVEGYAASYTGNASTGIRITNTYTAETDPGTPPSPALPDPPLMDIPLRVVWLDDNNASGTRPDEVTVHLLSGGSIIASLRISPAHTAGAPAVAEVTQGGVTTEVPLFPQDDNSWYGLFRNAPADLSYSVWEEAVQDYSTTYSGSAVEGFVVTNVYTPGTTDPGVPPAPDAPITPPDSGDIPGSGSDTEAGLDEEPPMIPQTGAQLLPVYLLMAGGALLVLVGAADLYKGREDE